MSDKLIWLYLIGLGYYFLGTQKQCNTNPCYKRGEQGVEYAKYVNPVYEITFEYPKHWVENKKYQSRYEGPEGFFEVSGIRTLGRNIDQVTQQEIDIPIEPFGSTPEIKILTIDGEPARLILPSADQKKIFEREVALIVKDKKPVQEGEETYDYTIIWSDRRTIQKIIDTFKFIDVEEK